MQKTKNWFTLVELIVVITILAILWTIAFISLQWYTRDARDSWRITNLSKINRYLEVFKIDNYLAYPDDYVELRASWSVILFQWNFWKWVWEKVKVWDLPKDSLDDTYYTYSIDKRQKNYQIMTFLEKPSLLSFWVQKASAKWQYEDRYPKVMWNKIGIILDKENTPIQNIEEVKTSSWLDIVNTNLDYISIISDNYFISWSWSKLYASNPTSSCKRIIDVYWKVKWIYTINPKWKDINVYCDSRYPNSNFYDFIEDWDMEDTHWNNWELTSNVAKTQEESHSGQYSLRFEKIYDYKSNNLTFIDPTKEYILEWYFKWITTDGSPTYFSYWFAEYDEDFKLITPARVNLIPWTETTLSQEVKETDRAIHFYCDDTIYNNWYNWIIYHSLVAFEIDDSWAYNDLPNSNLSWYISNQYYQTVKSLLSRSGNNCTISYHPNVPGGRVWKKYPAWTKIRLHRSWWTYNYKAAGKLSWEWQYFSWLVKWESLYWINNNYFRRWTRFVKILILPNRWWRNVDGVSYTTNPNAILYADDLKITIKK